MAATDYLSGMLGAIGVLAARYGQLQHGGGAVTSTSLLAAALLLSESAYEDIRAGRRYQTGGPDYRGPHPLNGLHQARDGWLLTVAPGSTHAEAERYLNAGIHADTVASATGRLSSLGIPAVPCLTPDQALTDPHFIEHGLWLHIDQPELGRLILPAPVLGPSRPLPAPATGEHNGLETVWRDAVVMSEAGG
jgi:crotonobetainyl-CoA:carnitine CoA-transferase CaiB-like acyl-CoA transferase